MTGTGQYSMDFAPPQASAAGLSWLGLVIDHRRLFEALQDEWMRPLEGTAGHLLGVQTYATRGASPPTGNQIATYLRVSPDRLPRLDVSIRRDGRWVRSTTSDVRSTDEALFWPGVLPTSAISEVFVTTEEEQARLTGLARVVSNVDLPGKGPAVRVGERTWDDSNIPEEVASGLALPAELDAVRGATAMALWAVPRIDPWLNLLAASLGIPPESLQKLAGEVDAQWWAWPPWLHFPESNWPADLQARLWLSATRVFRQRQGGEAVGATEFIREIAAMAARTGSDSDTAVLDAWIHETVGILRADTTIRLDDWRSSPVGKAIQLVLVRPEPARFKTWLDDLQTLPPGVWWSAAVLCGLLHGYRRLELQFRGDETQRRFLAAHALRACGTAFASTEWPGVPTSVPTWRRESGQLVFSWGETVFCTKPENHRGRWFSADMEDREVKRAAEALARKVQWPCLHLELPLPDGQLELLGPGTVEIRVTPSPHLNVSGTPRLKLPEGARIEHVLDPKAFLRCVATEGGGSLPAPPIPRQGLAQREHPEIPGLRYIRDFLTEADETELVGTIDRSEWRPDLKRRVQHYGWRYDYKARQVDPSMWLGPLPDWAAKLASRLHSLGLVQHIPDQVIVNEYVGRQGISRHIDCVPCFADGIATLSLLESWEMLFQEEESGRKVAQLLERRSIAVMTADARYRWSHEIPKRQNEPNGLRRNRRISVTFRKVNVTEIQRRGSR